MTEGCFQVVMGHLRKSSQDGVVPAFTVEAGRRSCSGTPVP